MKTLLFTTMLVFGGSFVPSSKQNTVYICVSPSAKKYHFKKSCSGLQRCTHTIKAVTKNEALNNGYTVCLKE